MDARSSKGADLPLPGAPTFLAARRSSLGWWPHQDAPAPAPNLLGVGNPGPNYEDDVRKNTRSSLVSRTQVSTCERAWLIVLDIRLGSQTYRFILSREVSLKLLESRPSQHQSQFDSLF